MVGAARPVLFFDLAVKATLVGLLVLAVSRPDLPQFEGDSYSVWRATTYPTSLLVVPLGWALFGRSRAKPFPYGLDLLLPLPLIVDVAAPQLYHGVVWWDKFMHLVSWGVLGAVAVLLLSWFRLDRVPLAVLAIVTGVVVGVLWELFEYVVWVRPSPDMASTEFADTVGDLTCDVAALVVAVASTLVVTSRDGIPRRAGRTRLELAGADPMEVLGPS